MFLFLNSSLRGDTVKELCLQVNSPRLTVDSFDKLNLFVLNIFGSPSAMVGSKLAECETIAMSFWCWQHSGKHILQEYLPQIRKPLQSNSVHKSKLAFTKMVINGSTYPSLIPQRLQMHFSLGKKKTDGQEHHIHSMFVVSFLYFQQSCYPYLSWG